ncbi:MAG: hypothetical protein A2X46_16865 [Lentisphaerae bacterium GWF2_57_35]|nr:MAG: hypothetical protein A2X46_16865 [Lentisphaerae bacterium GWF2_57_35]
MLQRLVLIATVTAVSSTRLQAGESEDALWFPVGETLTYHMHWGLLPVGYSILFTEWAVVEGRKLLVVRFTAHSNRFMDTIYPVNDELVCYIDPVTFLPIYLAKKTREGPTRGDDELFFDHQNKVARWVDHIKNRTVEYPIQADTHGLVSFLYWMRSQALTPGDERDSELAIDDQLQHFRIKAIKQQNIRLDGFGTIPSVLLKVSVDSNEFFVRKIPGYVWVSTDQRRIVTQMYIKAPIGRIKVLLHSIQEPEDEGPFLAAHPPPVLPHNLNLLKRL